MQFITLHVCTVFSVQTIKIVLTVVLQKDYIYTSKVSGSES